MSNLNHPKQIKCKFCEETFDETYKLEQHLKKHESKGFRCEHCEKMFHLEWRFNKHIKSHSVKSTRKCHYFNNDKICPYEEIGCMFLHETSVKYDNLYMVNQSYLKMLMMKILIMEMILLMLRLILTQTRSMSVILVEKSLKLKVNFGTTKAVMKCVDMDVRSLEHTTERNIISNST